MSIADSKPSFGYAGGLDWQVQNILVAGKVISCGDSVYRIEESMSSGLAITCIASVATFCLQIYVVIELILVVPSETRSKALVLGKGGYR